MNTYLITGAAQGLGRALAVHLADSNNQLILLDKNKKALHQLADEIETLCETALFPMDLLGATPDHYQQLESAIQENYQKLDGVFLNATYFHGFAPIEHTAIEDWYRTIQINLNANFHLIQHTLPLLNQAANGKLVAITDREVQAHPAYYGAYGAAKAGLSQLLKTLAAENKQDNISYYLAQLNAFQSNMRRKHFPSENPNDLPTVQTIASHLCDLVCNNLQSEFINKL